MRAAAISCRISSPPHPSTPLPAPSGRPPPCGGGRARRRALLPPRCCFPYVPACFLGVCLPASLLGPHNPLGSGVSATDRSHQRRADQPPARIARHTTPFHGEARPIGHVPIGRCCLTHAMDWPIMPLRYARGNSGLAFARRRRLRAHPAQGKRKLEHGRSQQPHRCNPPSEIAHLPGEKSVPSLAFLRNLGQFQRAPCTHKCSSYAERAAFSTIHSTLSRDFPLTTSGRTSSRAKGSFGASLLGGIDRRSGPNEHDIRRVPMPCSSPNSE